MRGAEAPRLHKRRNDVDPYTVKITNLEFIAEVAMANVLANLSASDCKALKEDFARRRPSTLPPRSGPVDIEHLKAFDAALASDTAHFIEKVSAREAEIRARRA